MRRDDPELWIRLGGPEGRFQGKQKEYKGIQGNSREFTGNIKGIHAFLTPDLRKTNVFAPPKPQPLEKLRFGLSKR